MQDEKDYEDKDFKNAEKEALSDVCIGNYKEYLKNGEISFDVYHNYIKDGYTRGKILFGIFFKIFDMNQEQVDRFEEYLLQVICEY